MMRPGPDSVHLKYLYWCHYQYFPLLKLRILSGTKVEHNPRWFYAFLKNAGFCEKSRIVEVLYSIANNQDQSLLKSIERKDPLFPQYFQFLVLNLWKFSENYPGFSPQGTTPMYTVRISSKLHLKSPITLSQPWGWLCPQNIHQPCLLCILSAMVGLVLLDGSHFGQSCTSQPLAAPRDIAEPETGFAMSISLILGPEHLAANCLVEARVWCILEGWSPPGNLMST